MAASTTPRPTTEQLLTQLAEAVWAADERWAAELASPERKAEYKAAKATYREAEGKAIARGATQACRRCGGAGGWEGWPGYTCFECGGSGREPWRKVSFQAEPPTRAKREAAAEAEQARLDEQYAQALATLPPAVAQALTEASELCGAWRMADEGYTDSPGAEAERPTREHYFREDLAVKLRRYGTLSEAQVAAVQRGLDREAAKAAEREAVVAQGPLEPGRQQLEGVVLSHKWTEDKGYGSQHKMLLQLATGHKLWGTVPRSLEDAVRPSQDGETGEWVDGASPQLEGTTVRLTATVEPKAGDPTFAYYSRPTGAVVVAPAAPRAEAEVQA